jgi:plastocyanin
MNGCSRSSHNSTTESLRAPNLEPGLVPADDLRRKGNVKKFVALLGIASLIAVFLGACDPTSCGSSGSSSTPTVHMCGRNFVESSITISKGQRLTLVDDDSMPHIIANGSWINSSPQPGREPGAPVVNNLQFNGNDSHTIGPFTTGTFHYYCTIHQGMNLTVMVH